MSGLLTTLLIGGLVIGGAVILINPENRCNYLGLCGQTAAAEVAPTAVTETIVTEDGTEVNDANQQSGATGSESTYKCCHCKMVGSTVKCEKNGDGNWVNPPAQGGKSNDQDLTASANSCSNGCSGTTATTPATKSTTAKTGSQGNPGSDKKGVQNKNNSVTGSGQKINPPAKTPAGKPNPYKGYVNANPKGYKPGGGTYYATAYIANDHYYLMNNNNVSNARYTEEMYPHPLGIDAPFIHRPAANVYRPNVRGGRFFF